MYQSWVYLFLHRKPQTNFDLMSDDVSRKSIVRTECLLFWTVISKL